MGVSTYSEVVATPKAEPKVVVLPVAISGDSCSASIDGDVTTISIGGKSIALNALQLSDVKELVNSL